MKSKCFCALLAVLPGSLAMGLDLFDLDVLGPLQEALASPAGLLLCVLVCVGTFTPTP